MKIKRVMDGMELTVELTDQEMWEIYRAQKLAFMREDVAAELDGRDIYVEPEMLDQIAFDALGMYEGSDTNGELYAECINDTIDHLLHL